MRIASKAAPKTNEHEHVWAKGDDVARCACPRSKGGCAEGAPNFRAVVQEYVSGRTTSFVAAALDGSLLGGESHERYRSRSQ